jgi:CO dehydrogenase/acetyl-CoA synthase epsilon subunit
VAKIYIKEQKYNNINSSFNYKLIIFLDICNYIKLLKEGYLRAFLIMLKGLALNRFYNAKLL